MDAKPDLAQQEGYYTQRWNAFALANKLDLQRVTAVLETLARIGLRRLLSTKFEVHDVRSIIPEFGVRGSYRFVNSAKARSALHAIGAGRLWERVRLRAMYGLHLVAHAQRSHHG